MALANFTPAYQNTLSNPFISTTALPPISSKRDLLYHPEDHQQVKDETVTPSSYKNNPYSTPTHRRAKHRKRSGAPYLPPPNTFASYPSQVNSAHQINSQIYSMQGEQQNIYQNTRLPSQVNAGPPSKQYLPPAPPRYGTDGRYVHDPSGDYDAPTYTDDRVQQNNNPYGQPLPAYNTEYPSNNGQYNNNFNQPNLSPYDNINNNQNKQNVPRQELNVKQPPYNPNPISAVPSVNNGEQFKSVNNNSGPAEGYPSRPPGFTKVDTRQGTGSGQPGKTQLHAVLDYDDDYYEEGNEDGLSVVKQQVTPLQGPILLRNGTVPVVPLYSYPTVNNGTFLQIPILWTALSLALGIDLRGQVIRGVPCVKRDYQLYCPTAGNTYPIDRIETFIDENKALMKRMYGDFSVRGPAASGGGRSRRAPGVPDPGESYFRTVRQAQGFSRPQDAPPPPPPPGNANGGNSTGRIDACESKTEIVTPYWALNSARKLRAVVNTMHFEQAIHQEVCSKTQTTRCAGDCGCEQKYKWHRLLAYDPDEDCAGIFMDWFLFPSCCVCRCNP